MLTFALRLTQAGRRWLPLCLAIIVACNHRETAGFTDLISPSVASRENRVLVLSNGRIAQGNIRQVTGGYSVEKPNGRMLIPYAHVKLIAVDMTDAYRKQRITMVNPSVNSHIALARWCLAYNLESEARKELYDALLLDPLRDDARQMLQRIEQRRNPEAPVDRPPAPTAVVKDSEFQPAATTSLAGLSPDAASDFVRHVQPILVNKCGNGSCHSTHAENGFRLAHVRLGASSHRGAVERNLAMTLQYVTQQNPDASPLLTIPRDRHEAGGTFVFRGSAGDEQFAVIRNWVKAVSANNSQPKITAAIEPPDVLLEEIRNRALGLPTNASNTSRDTGRQDTTLIRGRPEEPLQAPDTRSVNSLLRPRPNDPFNPEVFNRANR